MFKHLSLKPPQHNAWLLSILTCFTLLAWISWGKLAHPIFDTGQEAEISARLLNGQLLYQDLQTYYTPLSYYANAIALFLFGHHLQVLYGVGLILSLSVTLLVYQLAKQLTNPPWAALCAVYLLIYCAFSPGGLFNLVAPYSYGAVYATVFCLLAFTAIDRYGHTAKIRWLIAAAIACGLAGLAKQEYGVAALAGVLVGANLCPAKNLTARLARSLLIVLVTTACVILLLSPLAQQVSWEKIYTSLVPISKSRILSESGLFYFSPARTFEIWSYTFKNFFAGSLIIWAAIIVARWFSRRKWIPKIKWLRLAIEALISIALTWISLKLGQRVLGRWGINVFQPLANVSWFLPVLAAWFAFYWQRLVRDRHAPLLWTLFVFSVLIYARFCFAIDFYGIYAVAGVLLFFTWLYKITVRIRTSVWKYLLICLLIATTFNLLELARYRYPIQSDRGIIYTKNEELAATFNSVIGYINNSKAKSVLMIPAGAVLNFLTATHSPSKETIFLPGILPSVDAQKEFLTRMQNQPPELIVYADVPLWWLNKGYQSLSEYNPLVDDWIVGQHRLIYSSPKLLYDGHEWILRVYAPI